MEPKTSQNISIWKQYQFTYEILSQYQLNVTVLNTATMCRFDLKNLKLKNINCKGFQMSLTNQKDFKMNVQEIRQQKQNQLQEKQQQKHLHMLHITIVFSSSFLINIQQQLLLPFKGKVSELQFLHNTIDKLQNKVKKIQQKQNNPNSSKIIKYIPQKQFKPKQEYDESQYDIMQFQSIPLPEHCKYLIQISMILNCKNRYFYLYQDKATYRSVFPNGAIMVPAQANLKNVPINISYVFDNRTQKVNKHTFYAYDVADYPYNVINLVITAKKIEE